jgi:hypothetical protein
LNTGNNPEKGNYKISGGTNYKEMIFRLSDRGEFDSAKASFKRNRISVTQGTVDLFYDGQAIITYGDDGPIETDYKMTDKQNIDLIKRLFFKGDKINGILPLGGNYHSSQWNEPNVAGHVRFDERKDEKTGKKILFIQELEEDPNVPALKSTTWTDKILKDLLKYAVKNDYELISWNNGDQYLKATVDVEGNLDNLQYWAMPHGKYGFTGYSGKEIIMKPNFLSPQELKALLGETIAQRIIDLENQTNSVEQTQFGELQDLDLKIGMPLKAFYDQGLAKRIKDLYPEVQCVSSLATIDVEEGKIDVESFPITDALKAQFTSQETPASSFEDQKQAIRREYADKGYTLYYKTSDESWNLTLKEDRVADNGQTFSPGEVVLTLDKEEFLDVEKSTTALEEKIHGMSSSDQQVEPAAITPLKKQKTVAVLPYNRQVGSMASKYLGRFLNELGIAQELVDCDEFYGKVENASYQDLIIEKHDELLYLTHYFVQNGDKVMDSEMVFSLNSNNGRLTLQETACQDPLNGGEHRAFDKTFANTFAKNLISQGFNSQPFINLHTANAETVTGSQKDYPPSHPEYYKQGGIPLDDGQIHGSKGFAKNAEGNIDLDKLLSETVPQSPEKIKTLLLILQKKTIDKLESIESRYFQLKVNEVQDPVEFSLAHNQIVHNKSILLAIEGALSELKPKLSVESDIKHKANDKEILAIEDIVPNTEGYRDYFGKINMQKLLMQGGLPTDPKALRPLITTKLSVAESTLQQKVQQYEKSQTENSADNSYLAVQMKQIGQMKGRVQVLNEALQEVDEDLEDQPRMAI